MSAIDPTVASALDKHISTAEEDEDDLIASLEADDAEQSFREQRLQQLHQELTRAKAMREEGGGTYVEIKEEKELMDITTTSRFCVVHFLKSDFGRCAIMDAKLEVS
jgi:hypothetical protein